MVIKSKLMKHRYRGVWILNFIEKAINFFLFLFNEGTWDFLNPLPVCSAVVHGVAVAGIYLRLQLKPREWAVNELSGATRQDRTQHDVTHILSDNGAICRVRDEWIRFL